MTRKQIKRSQVAATEIQRIVRGWHQRLQAAKDMSRMKSLLAEEKARLERLRYT